MIVVICYQQISSRYYEGILAETRNTMRSVSLALLQSDADYGAFPNAGTAKLVVEQTDSKLRIGTGSANEIFR